VTNQSLHGLCEDREDERKTGSKRGRMGGSTIKASGLPMANTLTLASSLPVAKTRPDFFPSWMLVIFSPLGSLPSSLGKKKKREKGKEEEKPLEYSCSSLFFFFSFCALTELDC